MALVHQRVWSGEARRESPWYFPIRPFWDELAHRDRFPSPEELTEIYARATQLRDDLPEEARRLRFASAPPKRRRPRHEAVDVGTLYEGRIVLHGEVPTRADDWHDFFNVLSFCAFPAAKWALHARQFALWQSRIAPGARRLPGARTREQDALSLFDEGGIALVVAEAAMPELDPRGEDLESAARALCEAGLARLFPFGHALYEHIVEGLACPLGTLHLVRMNFSGLSESALLCALDRALSRDLSAPAHFTQPSPARGISLNERAAR